MVLARSTDGGATWTVSTFAHDDRYGNACCDPTLSWDAYGNLFMAWLDLEDSGAIPVAISTDGGATFRMLKVLRPNPPTVRAEDATAATRTRAKRTKGEKPGGGEKEREPSPKGSSVDQPTIVAGEGSVWLTWNNNGMMQASGARVTGLGQVGKFYKREDIPKSRDCSFGDIAIGPDGPGVRGLHQGQGGNAAPRSRPSARRPIPTGWGPKGSRRRRRSPRRTCSSTTRSAAALALGRRGDRARVGHRRDQPALGPALPAVDRRAAEREQRHRHLAPVLRRRGRHVERRPRVNDVTTNAQFLPRIALDPTTGNLAIGWHDARNDAGDHGFGDTDGKPNTDAMYYLTFSTDGGATFAPAVAVSGGVSNAKDARNGIDFGDYTGLAFFGGVAMPAWSDNSNSTGDNPAGAFKTFDIYTARVSRSDAELIDRRWRRGASSRPVRSTITRAGPTVSRISARSSLRLHAVERAERAEPLSEMARSARS